MANYRVKEIFGPTLQGEGAHAGRACVFLRFAACNLACAWCDTDFSPQGARLLTAAEIARELTHIDIYKSRLVIVTGGEPALQWNHEIATALGESGFLIHMESNGTTALAAPVDWLTVSPKPQFHGRHHQLVCGDVFVANECKVVVDRTVDLDVLRGYEQRYQCEHWFLQPCDDPEEPDSLARAIEMVSQRPRWRLSLQTHKIINVR